MLAGSDPGGCSIGGLRSLASAFPPRAGLIVDAAFEADERSYVARRSPWGSGDATLPSGDPSVALRCIASRSRQAKAVSAPSEAVGSVDECIERQIGASNIQTGSS